MVLCTGPTQHVTARCHEKIPDRLRKGLKVFGLGSAKMRITALLLFAKSNAFHTPHVVSSPHMCNSIRSALRITPLCTLSIRRSGLEDKLQRRWQRELKWKSVSKSNPVSILAHRIRDAPARWRTRWDCVTELLWPFNKSDEFDRDVVSSPLYTATNSLAVSASALPMGWRTFGDPESGRPYYVNPDGISTWNRPLATDPH